MKSEIVKVVQVDQPASGAPEQDPPPAHLIENLTTDVGWLLVTAGVIGVIMPGIPGAPFLLIGGFVVTPGGTRLLSRWVGKNPPKFVNGALKQIGRFVEDIDRRYPPLPKRPR
jgi:hypothetical protein